MNTFNYGNKARRGKAKEAQIKERDSGADMNSMIRFKHEEVLALRKNNTIIEVGGV